MKHLRENRDPGLPDEKTDNPSLTPAFEYTPEMLEIAKHAFPQAKRLHQAIAENNPAAYKMAKKRFVNLNIAVGNANLTVVMSPTLGIPQAIINQLEVQIYDSTIRLHCASDLLRLLDAMDNADKAFGDLKSLTQH